jgi:hypothetical protein
MRVLIAKFSMEKLKDRSPAASEADILQKRDIQTSASLWSIEKLEDKFD